MDKYVEEKDLEQTSTAQNGGSQDGTDDGAAGADPVPVHVPRGRRAAIVSEVSSSTAVADAPKRFFPKSQEESDQIYRAISSNILFAHLDPVQSKEVIDAMERKVYRKGDWIIRQGEDGNDFYIVEKGVCETYIKATDPTTGEVVEKMVKTYTDGMSFGELALMYNCPRAASIRVASDECTVWDLDRATFQRVVIGSTREKRLKFEKFLSEIELFATLTPAERSKIADVLVERTVPAGENIITAGDTSDTSFYLLISGTAIATKEIDGQLRTVMNYAAGNYFGELALLDTSPRAANVVAVTDCRVASLDRDAFERLLGPVKDLLERGKAKYSEADQVAKSKASE